MQLRLRSPLVAVPVAAVAAVAVVSTAWAANDGGSGVRASATNPEQRFTAALTGENEAPGPGDPDGLGIALVTINPATGLVCINVDAEGIDPIVAYHIHEAPEGMPGPVRVNFEVPPGNTEIDLATCTESTPEQAQAIVANPAGFYVNLHTEPFPDGAIRGQLTPRQDPPGSLVLLPEPLRAYDSRTGTDGPITNDTSRIVDLTMGQSGDGTEQIAVPVGARAAVVTLTITETVEAGFLALSSAALDGRPATSTINWRTSGADIATTTTVAVDGAGRVQVTSGPNSTHFIVDVVGYYL